MNEISKYLTDYIREQFKHVHLEKIDKNHKFIKIIKQDILSANEQWKIRMRTFRFEPDADRTIAKGAKYDQISDKIRSLIERQTFFNKTFEFSFGGGSDDRPSSVIKIHLHYFLSSTDPSIRVLDVNKVSKYLQKCMQKIYVWFYIANKYKLNICSKNLNVYLYLINLPKVFPMDKGGAYKNRNSNDFMEINTSHQDILTTQTQKKRPLDIHSVNTGFTYGCLPRDTPNEIYVFREEEWYKVLIHETIHSFGMEFSNREPLENYANKRISQIFNLSPISSENVYGRGYNIFESYTEMTAEIMNILIYHFLHKDIHIGTSGHHTSLERLVEVEQKFSCLQCVKILEHFKELNCLAETKIDLSTTRSDKFSEMFIFSKYKERTNVFSYYILKSMLMFHINSYMNWIIEGNLGSLNFNKTMENIKRYCDLIERYDTSLQYLDVIVKMRETVERENPSKLELRTLKMTVLEY